VGFLCPESYFALKSVVPSDEGIAVAQNEEVARFTLNGGLSVSYLILPASDGVNLGGPLPNFGGVCPEPRLALKSVFPPDEGINVYLTDFIYMISPRASLRKVEFSFTA
jgi:hypothetical protein